MHSYILKSWQTVQGMLEKFFVLLPEVVLGIIVFALFWLIALAVERVVEYFSHKHRQTTNLGLVLGRLSRAVVIIVGALVALTIVAPTFHTGDLIKVLGIGGIAIGFAFRDILQNFLAGILLLLHEPFRIGDQIKIDEFEGTVEAIQTRATTIKTYDSRRIVIPNTELFTKPVTVNTAYDCRRAEYVVGIGFGDDMERARLRGDTRGGRCAGRSAAPGTNERSGKLQRADQGSLLDEAPGTYEPAACSECGYLCSQIQTYRSWY